MEIRDDFPEKQKVRNQANNFKGCHPLNQNQKNENTKGPYSNSYASSASSFCSGIPVQKILKAQLK